MSGLIALYPNAWRERYELEFRALMAERPPSPRDRLDIVRGALDARFHPQLNSTNLDRTPLRIRVAAAVAALGGAIWVVAGLAFLGSSIIPGLGYKDSSLAVVIAIAAASVTGIAASMISRSLSGPHVVLSISAASIVFGGLAMTLPWPVVALGYFTAMIATVLFGLIATPRLGLIGIVLAVGALLALGFNTEDQRALLLVPLGAGWLLFGLVLGIRGIRSMDPEATHVPMRT